MEVVSDGGEVRLSPARAGDEPYLMAMHLPGVAVVVGKNRRRTGAYAIRELRAEVLLLDDGFQYWRLHKDHEIVLIDCLCPFGGDRLLPRGLLREPVSHLRRADEVWLTHADLVSEQARATIRRRVCDVRPDLPVAETVHAPVRLEGVDGASAEPASLCGQRVGALSGIGNPDSFERTLAQLGAAEVVPVRFADHHRFRPGELRRRTAPLAGRVDMLVTTEKDRVRLPVEEAMLPLWVLQVEMRFRGEAPGLPV
jgi:tetraacyldisaccharide 4'-kinase